MANARGKQATYRHLGTSRPAEPSAAADPATLLAQYGSVTARLAVEQASTLGWERSVTPGGRVIGMETFGASAPLKELQKKVGFQPESVAAIARMLVRARHERFEEAR